MPQPEESEIFLGELMGAPEVTAEAPKQFNRRNFFLKLGVTAGVSAAGYFKRNEIWNWIERDVLEVPAAIRESYRKPGTTRDIIVEPEGKYPYPESTLHTYASEELRLFPNKTGVKDATIIATNIANRVAERALALVKDNKEAGRSGSKLEYQAAFQKLASSKEGLNAYMKLIALELIRAGCFYKIEGSLDTAVDSSKHNDSRFHLDCDLLCHVALHCASRHDMPLEAVRAPSHMYIGSPAYEDFAIEMTAFRGRRNFKQNGLRQQSFISVGEAYFCTHRTQKLHFSRIYSDEVKRIGYFTPLSIEEIRESAVGNLLIELVKDSLKNGEPEQFSYICSIADRELVRYSGKELIAQNVYAVHAMTRDYYVKQWGLSNKSNAEARARALFHAKRIERLKNTHGQFLISKSDEQDQAILEALEA